MFEDGSWRDHYWLLEKARAYRRNAASPEAHPLQRRNWLWCAQECERAYAQANAVRNRPERVVGNTGN